MIDPAAGYLLIGALALLFLGASGHKWRALAEFEAVLANYRLLPGAVTPTFKWLLPLVEAAVGLALLVPATRPGAALVGAALLLGYAAAITINLRRGRLDLDCGCGPRSERRSIAAWMVVRNVALAVLLSVAAAPWALRPLGAVDALTVAGGIAIEVLLYLSIDELLGRVRPRVLALRRPA